MLLSLTNFLLWLQPAAVAAGGGDAGGGDAGGGAAGSQLCTMQVAIMGGILLFTWFFMIRPEQKKREEQEALLKALKPGMKVRTTGGILGEIVRMDEHEVVLAVADKVRLNVLRSHIVGPEVDRAAVAAAKEAKDAAATKKKGSDDPTSESASKPKDLNG